MKNILVTYIVSVDHKSAGSDHRAYSTMHLNVDGMSINENGHLCVWKRNQCSDLFQGSFPVRLMKRILPIRAAIEQSITRIRLHSSGREIPPPKELPSEMDC